MKAFFQSRTFWGLLLWLPMAGVSVWGLCEMAYYLHVGKTIPPVSIAIVMAFCAATVMVGKDLLHVLNSDSKE